MSKIDHYIRAATRNNTRLSYQSAIEHYEVTWGGLLPATADCIARYLSEHAETHALSTLRHRVAAIAQWHQTQGFPDPTKAPLVKKVLKGIAELHPPVVKQAKPLQLDQLDVLIQWVDKQLQRALADSDRPAILTHCRNKALVLVGFWRAFRSDELYRMAVEQVQVSPGQGMEIVLPRSKSDRSNQGRSFKAPALSRLCPVVAYEDWIANAHLTEGPVFRGIDRWGHISNEAMKPSSISILIKKLLGQAGIPDAAKYTSHSLRRGFATWANTNQWDVKTLMEHVGWKDVQSALRYIDAPDPFAQRRIEQGLSMTPALESQEQRTILHVAFALRRYHKRVKTKKKARGLIERLCFQSHDMELLDHEGRKYQIAVRHDSAEHLDEILDELLHEMHEIAGDNKCILEAYIEDPSDNRVWE